MLKHLLLILITLFATTGCGIGERERRLKEQSEALSLRERAVALKETELKLKEQELRSRETRLDSTIRDTAFVHHPEIVGRWDVKMNCIQTDCPGSAIGDTKTEQWDISYRGKSLIAKVLDKNNVTRVYTGSYAGNVINLVSQSYESNPALTTIMQIRLQPTADGRLEGIREIDRPDNCRVIFNLQLTRRQG